MAALSTVLAIAAIASSAASVASTLTQKPPKAPAAAKLPDAPSEDVAAAERQAAVSRVRKQRAGGSSGGRSSTLLSGPLGITDPAPTVRKTLLGS